MKREIKFRAWDGNKMILENKFVAADINFMTFGGHIYKEGYLQSWQLMQYTGLKDKNGKEIYEGDIVEFRCDGCTMENLGKIKRDVIEFRDGSFDIRDWSRWETKWIEVIGNIYENPELLTN